jgi:nucleoside-diphosphate-sugar epimerase
MEVAVRVLVTGGTGFLGSHVARRLLHDGYAVRLLGRDFSQVADLLDDGVEPCRVDLRDAPAVIAACEGVDYVVHSGAIAKPWGPREEFHQVNVAGTSAVIDGCRRHQVERLVAISSPAVIFSGDDLVDATEARPYPATFSSDYAATKKLAEDRLNAARDVPSVILRPKAIFGPGDRALLPRLVAAARAGRLPQIGDGRNLVDMTFVENVVHAIMLALQSPVAVGRTYHITNDEHVRLWAVIRSLLRTVGLSDRLPQVPLPIMLALAGSLEAAATLTGREPLLTRYSVAILARTQTYDITAARRDLGYTPVVSVSDGITQTLASLA